MQPGMIALIYNPRASVTKTERLLSSRAIWTILQDPMFKITNKQQQKPTSKLGMVGSRTVI